jgi:hypothetical protein
MAQTQERQTSGGAKRLALGALVALGVATGLLTTLPVGSAAAYPGGEKEVQDCNSWDNICYLK